MSRSVLVTGASKGIGRAIALKLATDGFCVLVHYHSDKGGAEATLEAICAAGGSGRLLQFDIADRSGCRAVLEAERKDTVEPEKTDDGAEAVAVDVEAVGKQLEEEAQSDEQE